MNKPPKRLVLLPLLCVRQVMEICFLLQLHETLQVVLIQLLFLDGHPNGAAWLGGMAAIGETAVLRQLYDIGKAVV